jgi:hypothetical protein
MPRLAGRGARRQILPRHEQQRLAVLRGQGPERTLELGVQLERRRRELFWSRELDAVEVRYRCPVAAPVGQQEVARGRDQPWPRVVAGNVGQATPGDRHRLGRQLVVVMGPAATGVRRDQTKMAEDAREAASSADLSFISRATSVPVESNRKRYSDKDSGDRRLSAWRAPRGACRPYHVPYWTSAHGVDAIGGAATAGQQTT